MGYDVKRFVNFDRESNHELICVICSDVLQNPKVTKCNHTFCWTCIDRWSTIRGTKTDETSLTVPCPLCREDINMEELTEPRQELRSKLNSLLIKCNYHRRGCSALLCLKHLKYHVAHCCSYSGHYYFHRRIKVPPFINRHSSGFTFTHNGNVTFAAVHLSRTQRIRTQRSTLIENTVV